MFKLPRSESRPRCEFEFLAKIASLVCVIAKLTPRTHQKQKNNILSMPQKIRFAENATHGESAP